MAEKITQEVAEALVADIIVEAEFGANSADPLLARASRSTLAIASILELVLTGEGPSVPVDNTLSQTVDGLVNRVSSLEGDRDTDSKNIGAVGDAVSAIDNRVTALEAHIGAADSATDDVKNADTDIANRLKSNADNANTDVINQPANNADTLAQQNGATDANSVTTGVDGASKSDAGALTA